MLFFDLSPVEGRGTVVVTSARLVVTVRGEEGARVVVAQRSEGGVVNLGGAEVHQGAVEVEVGHTVQAWLLRPSSNLGLEVQGEVAVEEVRLIMDTKVVRPLSPSPSPLLFSSCSSFSPPHQEVEGTWRPRRKRSAPPSCTKRCLRSQQMSVLNV